MTQRINPAGWRILAGQEWAVPPNIFPALHTVTEATNDGHQLPDMEQTNGEDWLLVRHFRAGVRCRAGTGGWRDDEGDTWRLHPPVVPWRQDTRRVSLPLHAIWVRFIGGDRVGLQRLIVSRWGMARFQDADGRLLEQVRGMARLAEREGDDGYFAVMAGLMGMIDLLLKAVPVVDDLYRIGAADITPAPDPLMIKVRAYVAAHCCEALTREQVARHAGASVSTVERRCIETMGESLMKIAMRLRLRRAKSLLAAGATVKETAAQTGFYDAFHFSKAFKKHEGVPPSRFAADGR